MSRIQKVDIGFLNESEPWRLESRLFPSKVGGKPSWLDLENLPSVEDLRCGSCKKQMVFLCQVYAPYEDDEHNFHRTLFVFVCKQAICCRTNNSDNFKVFRSHLRKENKFYSAEPPLEQPDNEFKLTKWFQLCTVCGCLAEKRCAKCKEIYCCREHQVLDWKRGHKNNCGVTSKDLDSPSKLLFHEYELVRESEIESTHEVNDEDQLGEFERLKNEGKIGTMTEVSETDLQAHSSVEEDPTFLQFRKRVGEDSDQVLRYERGGTPLWIANEPKPTSIPDCEYCSGPRQFEFQVMPQMLSMLRENDLDWGIIIIYSCASSCTNVSGYKREHVFKQDVSCTNKAS